MQRILSRAPVRPGSLLTAYEDELRRLVDRGLAELTLTHSREVKRLDTLMRSIVEQSFDGIIAFSAEAQVSVANAAAEAMFGQAPGGLGGHRFDSLFPDFRRFRPLGGHQTAKLGGRFEGWASRKDGSRFPIELALSQIELEEGAQLVAVIRDITEGKAQEERLRHQALHDALTGLANRSLLSERLENALRLGRPLALLLLDLDRFKEVNDTLGHHVGDRLLQEFALRLGGCVRPGDTVARLGGDEFAILLPNGGDLAAAAAVAERIVTAVRAPFALADNIVAEVGASIGIALAPEHAEEAAKLLQAADVAMYAAKSAGMGPEVYDRARDRNSLRHLVVSGALRRAIVEDELDLHYQPKVCLRSGRVLGVEALVRWQHPELGLIAPDEFIPHAERSGLIRELMAWTLETALAGVAAFDTPLGVAVNMSAPSLQDDRLLDLVHAALERHSVEPGRLTLELTERAMLRDPEAAADVLGRLHAAGIKLSVDDFGTGYSSLALLQKLSVDELKLDRSFVAGMTTSRSDLVLVRSTIDLAHNLGLLAVAEGIESEEQLRLLRDLGCDLGQGYLFAKALPAEVFATWLSGPAIHLRPKSRQLVAAE